MKVKNWLFFNTTTCNAVIFHQKLSLSRQIEILIMTLA